MAKDPNLVGHLVLKKATVRWEGILALAATPGLHIEFSPRPPAPGLESSLEAGPQGFMV